MITKQAEGLRAAGHDVSICLIEGTARDGNQTDIPTVNIARRPNLDGTGSEWAFWPSAARSVLLTASRVPPCDVVIATWFPTVYLAHEVARRTGAVPVWLLQDFPEMFRHRFTQRAIRRAPSLVRGIIADAQYLIDESVYVPPHVMARTVPPALDDSFFEGPSAADDPWPRGGPLRILWAGTPARYKGFPEFLQMLGLLRSRGVEVEPTLLAPPSIRAFDTFGCRVLHGLSDAEVVREFRAADVVVSTVAPEGFGYPPLEAMAVGRPAVLVDSGGSREYHAHGENALVLPDREPMRLADAVERLVRDPDLVRHLVDGGLRTAARFRWPAMQERFQAALAEIVEAARARHRPAARDTRMDSRE